MPVADDGSGTQVGIRSLVGQALRKALIGALASPLKLFGAITADGKVQSLAPEPIACVPGQAQIAPEGARAHRAARRPALGLARHLAHAARRDGAGGRALVPGAGAARGAARHARVCARSASSARSAPAAPCASYLEARLAGQEAPLETGQRAWLEAQLVAQSVAPAQLAALADARAAAAQQALASEYGIEPERLSLGPPAERGARGRRPVWRSPSGRCPGRRARRSA